jgi:hypothetical protein
VIITHNADKAILAAENNKNKQLSYSVYKVSEICKHRAVVICNGYVQFFQYESMIYFKGIN